MNKIRKVVSTMLVALAFISAIGVPINAAAELSNQNGGSLTVHKYQIDETFVANEEYEQNGSEIADAIIGTRKGEDGETVDVRISDLAPLKGVKFKVEKVVPMTNDGVTEYLKDESFIEREITINDFGYATLTNLEFGVYKVTELPNSAIEEVADPFYVSVPHYDKNIGWIYDVHVYVKNKVKQPEIHKAVTELNNQHDTTNVFDEVKWIVTSEIPEDIATSVEYIVTDNLDKVLQYVDGSLEVSFVEADQGDKVILEEGLDYEFVLNKNNRTSYEWQDEMTIRLTDIGRVKVAAALPAEANGEKAWLTIEFNTKIELSEADLETILGSEIPNQAKLTYTNNLNLTFKPESEIPEVHLGGVLLKKVDAKGKVLTGAKFKIYTSLVEANAGINAIKNPQNKNEDWIVASGANGLVKFFGLAYGEIGQEHDDVNAKTKYWIVEIEAPKDAEGKSYNLLREPLEVEVNRVSHMEVNAITVVNTKFDLPLTGGAGTTVFLMAGIALVAVGIGTIVAVKKKRQVGA